MAVGIAILLLTMGVAVAQNPAAPIPAPGSQVSAPDGYTIHQSFDAGGHVVFAAGSGSMYDTLVNMQTGPRVLGETFTMRALPGKKHTLVDTITAVGNGFGGDPNNFTRLDASKGKIYDFSGMFRRDRQYFDYDLLGNPGIPSGYSIPIGPSASPTGHYAWPQVMDSPFMFNTVRRMTDTNLTLLPLSQATFRFAYSKNIFQGPSQTPSGNSVAGSEVIYEEYQRNSTDDFTAALDWKPIKGTKLTYEQQIDHYKGDSYFTMAPQYFTVQEADGTKVALLSSYQNYYPYGYSSSTGAFTPSGVCNTGSMINYSAGPPASGTILYANPAGGLPIIDPACAVISSYVRYQPTREIFPTEIFRLQSSSIKNVSMNGNIRHTTANMNLPNYYEAFNGLTVETSSTKSGKTTIKPPESEISYGGYANARRNALAVDYGIVWQATKTVSLSDQVSFSHVQQPGIAAFTSGTALVNASTSGLTINNSSLTSCVWSSSGTQTCTPTLPATPTTVYSVSSPVPGGSPSIGLPVPDYFGQKWVTNNATVTWDAAARATFSLTYRYRHHFIAEGIPRNLPVANCVAEIPPGYTSTTNVVTTCGTVTINENGGIFNAALRPASNWELNGSVEMIYADNVFTPVAPRQLQHYRVHTMYRPKPWATISGAYNDLERHNNTNNTGAASAAGPLDHVDHTRVVSLGAALYPNEHYGLDLNYAYSDVYSATNICFVGTATVMPGSTVPAAATPPTAGSSPLSSPLCYAVQTPQHGSAVAVFGPARDFEDAPTQYGSATVILSPNPKLKSNIGYRVSAVNGSRFFTDAQDVNGSLVSTYQTPFVNVAWTIHPGLIWKGEYDYYGYGEGGRSGAQWCSQVTSPSVGDTSEPVEACSTVANTAMSSATPVYGFTAPRNFHAGNLTLSVHYEF